MSMSKFGKIGVASVIALTAAAPAFAQSAEAIAATDLNIRSGPGPQYEVLGVIPGGESAAGDGCLAEASWCKVVFDGKTLTNKRSPSARAPQLSR